LGEQTKAQVPPALAKAQMFAVQSGMKEVLQHLSAVVKLVSVTEEQATKAFSTEREVWGVGGEVGVVLKGHKATKEKTVAFLAGEVIVTGVGKVAAERVWARLVQCAAPRIEFSKQRSTQ
jgi:hypothetical protein